MTLETQTKLIDEMVAENPESTIKDFLKLKKNPKKARELLLKRATITLNKICEERYRTLKSDYAQLVAR
jgi:hypothetical protein